MTRLTQFVVFIVLIILVAGCNTSQGESQKAVADMNVPDTIAFKDQLTRKYLNSNKEVIKDYYTFKSMTGGYTMYFPVDAIVLQEGLALNSDVFETFRFNEEDSSKQLVYDYKVTYENRSITSDIELNFALLSSDVGYEGNYEQLDHEGKTYYYATLVQKGEKVNTYHYISYIKSTQNDKAISYIMSVKENNVSEKSERKPEELEEKYLKMIKSIHFT